jgi:hypothetical protein
MAELPPVKDLMTKGFFNAAGWFDAEDVQELLIMYRAGVPLQHGEYPTGMQTYTTIPERVQEKIRKLISMVNSETDLEIHDVAPVKTLYLSSRKLLDWHQDHESYYKTGDHYHYINVYAPLHKPEPTKTNLCVVPMDKLKDACEPLHDACFGTGAAVYLHAQGEPKRVLRIDDAVGTVDLYDCDLEQVMEAPQLRAGDALVIRGDVVHRTEDVQTERIVLSLRLEGKHSRFRISNLLTGSAMKLNTFAVANAYGWARQAAIVLSQSGFSAPVSELDELEQRVNEGVVRRVPFTLAYVSLRVVFMSSLFHKLSLNSLFPSTYVMGYQLSPKLAAMKQAASSDPASKLTLQPTPITFGPRTSTVAREAYGVSADATELVPPPLPIF